MKKIDHKGIATGLEIAVIGMAGRFPGAKNLDEFWSNLTNGVESVTFFSDKELEEAGIAPEVLNQPNYVKAVGVMEDIDCFDAAFFACTPSEAEAMDPQMRIFYECAWSALEDAGYVPNSYRGSIGLYAGAAGHPRWEGLSLLSDSNSASERFGQWQLRDKDFLTTRVSYDLNLKGPSVTIYTACSTSLVAVHIACRALLSGECKMALAGGVTAIILKKSGYYYQKEMIASPDGHCRAFDGRAGGTASGDGVGIVVLKRLKNAIADEDNIYVVIKGSSINNDGRRKLGYTAPSIDGQSEAIRVALRMARVEPESITYVETHGTGTTLGDPAEIEGLKLAFKTDRKQFCAIGSVKTNVGHLDIAAGIAGFIKTVLALKHRLIPPSLHFVTPNPKIGFENSPFYVNTQLMEWKNDSFLLRAGVSSFGIGGTNVHVVLEEAPEICWGEVSLPSREYQLVLLSAKTKSALERVTENMVLYLKKNTDICFADTAYTLQVGRKAFQYRRILVCSDVNEAVKELSSPDFRKVHTFFSKEVTMPVIFMFCGLGSQYINMGLDLYREEPIFREEMDRCFDILEGLTDYDIKGILYPNLHTIQPPVRNPQPAASSADINRFEIAQIVIFIFEYALANLIMKWGIKPDAMIGYSFGEYAAACISGVFSLENALKLVVFRGRLIQKLPAGVMLSVPLSKKDLKPLLNNDLSLAIDNGPSCIVSGPNDVINAFEEEMKKKRYLCMRIQSSQPLHSRIMEPILQEFAEKVGRFHLKEPQIPYISNVTGKWVMGKETTDPGYWARHLRETVQFANGIKELIKKENSIFVEIGPGQDLSTLVVRHIEKNSNHHVINLIKPPGKEISDVRYLVNKIGRLWLYGKNIDWSEFHSGEKRYRISLPTYPFERQRYWIERDLSMINTEMLSYNSRLSKRKDISNWFYIPSWKQTVSPLLLNPEDLIGHKRSWLIFVDDYGIGAEIAKKLQKKGHDVIRVIKGDSFSRNNDWEYAINVGQHRDYEALITGLLVNNKKPEVIVHLWSVMPIGGDNKSGIEFFHKCQYQGFYSLLFLIQALAKHELVHTIIDQKNITGSIQVVVIANNSLAVTGKEKICPEKVTVLGLCKTIPLEYQNIMCQSIDLVIPGTEPWKDSNLVDQLTSELLSEATDLTIAYRENSRWVRHFEPIRLDHRSGRPLKLKERGVYLITGGLGRDSLVRAKYLAKIVKAKLILIGRSGLPDRDNWEEWLDSHNEDDQISVKIKNVREIEALGAEVLTISADVANENDMNSVMKQIDEKFGKIDGVIHAAGITNIESSVLIPGIGCNETELHFKPKVYGLYTLDKVLKGRTIDFCLLTSSIISFFGGVGLSAYTAASNFMDAFVHKLNQENSVPWMSLNWEGSSPQETEDTFHRILNLGPIPQVIVSKVDLGKRIDERFKSWLRHGELDVEQTVLSTLQRRPDLMDSYIAPRNETEEKLVRIWEKSFGIEPLGIHDDFFDLGGDSLKAITVTSKIYKEFNVEVPLAEFFRRSTIERLENYIKNAAKSEYFSIQPVEKKEYYGLSSAQKRLYILQQLEKDSIGYNETQVVLVEGKVDKDEFEETFQKLISRHETIRTSIILIENEPFQRIHQHHDVEFALEYYITVSKEQGAEKKKEVEEIMRNFVKPFDLSKAPFIRAALINLGKNSHVLVVDLHHIVTDAMSQEIFIKELMALSAGEELPLLTLQYKDYSQWQNLEKEKKAIKQQEKYWQKEFEGEIPILNMPIDYMRPAVQSFEGSEIGLELSKKETNALNEMARISGTTLFMVLLAVYNIFLSILSNQEDIVVGAPIAGRKHADLEQIIGVFVNTLALRNYPSGEKKFNIFLKEVRDQVLKAFENQDYPFEDLVGEVAVQRDMSRNPLFDVVFAFQNVFSVSQAISEKEIGGLKIKKYDTEHTTSKFDLTLSANEVHTRLHLSFNYCTKLFRKETIIRFICYFKAIISWVVENPEKKISQIEIITKEEKDRILYDFNDTEAKYPKDKTIHQLFEEKAARTPDKIVLIGMAYCALANALPTGPRESKRETGLTYLVLNEKSDKFARLLRSKGVKPGVIAAVMLKPSIEMFIGILAILKAGGAYLPIDLLLPAERKMYMLKDSGVHLLLTDGHADLISTVITDGMKVINDWNESIFAGDVSHPEPGNKSSYLAYVIYTSGSAGEPKGIMIEHQSLVNLCYWHKEYYNVTSTDRATKYANIGFDASVWEIFPYLIAGAVICIINEEIKLNIYELNNYFETHQITITFLPTQMCEQFMTIANKSLRVLLTGGDKLKNCKKRNYQLVNNYGPTENTVVSTSFIVEGSQTNIPIGKPIYNTKSYILNKYRQLQPIGVPGELCISGGNLARGYLNRPELTAKKFIKNPFPGGEWLYQTGDFTNWLPDGNIEFLGRIDHQVKIRGHRIELGEIERQLLKHNEIKEAVVICKGDESGDKYLFAYIVSDRELTVSELRDYLNTKLPNYMIPSYYVRIEEIPLTRNGKVNRKALISVDTRLDTGIEYVAPQSHNEIIIADIWKEVLKLDEVGIHDNFFDLGGTSMDIIRVNSRFRDIFENDIPIVTMYKYATIASFSQFLDKGEGEDIYPRRDRADTITRGKSDKHKMREMRKRRRK